VKQGIKEPNSSQLIDRINKAQNYIRIDTRIKHTIKALNYILNKPLISNQDIPVQTREIILSPDKPFTSYLRLTEILQNTRKYAKIIDPYIDETTLEILTHIPEGVPIQLLTAYTGGKKRAKRFLLACQRFKAERPQFQIRKCDKKLIHDRFIMSQIQGWSIGSSLKDLGKSMSMINVLSDQGKQETEKLFDGLWTKSKKLL
jgi:hypothetical protein